MKQVNPEGLTIKELREASGFKVSVGNVNGWFYQYPFIPFEGKTTFDIEYITICLN